MSEALKLILRAPIERDQDGWWHHPDGPEFEEDVAAFKAWLVQQGLELQQWHMDSDIGEQHPYADGDCHCLGWKPECPGPEWFLLGIFDTEEGPCVSWVRRKAEEAWSLNGVDGSWDYPNLTALIRDNFGSAAEGTSFGPGLGNGLKVGDTVHSGTVCKADPAVFLTDGDELLNHMFGAAAGSDAGEWVYNYGKRMSWPMLRNRWADAREAARTKAEVGHISTAFRV
ncbi:hypothetical protein [Pseudomonas sp. SWRI51]|uniref:hypothetical protein n=1 Tax=Pseudomonas sp. SWRI51 TaxID=2745491 RepID=UPI001EE30D15|nr:hypothetical protein [Pseudomonas sp. SWRI51]